MFHFLSLFWILCLVLCAVSIRPQYLRCMLEPDLGPDPDYRSRLPQDSAVFVLTRIRSQKFVKNRTRTRIRSHFSISALAGVCVVISQVRTWVNYGWNDDCSRSLNWSRILKLKDSKILKQERNRCLKK